MKTDLTPCAIAHYHRRAKIKNLCRVIAQPNTLQCVVVSPISFALHYSATQSVIARPHFSQMSQSQVLHYSTTLSAANTWPELRFKKRGYVDYKQQQVRLETNPQTLLHLSQDRRLLLERLKMKIQGFQSLTATWRDPHPYKFLVSCLISLWLLFLLLPHLHILLLFTFLQS